jgi:hypothetical protein
VGNWNAQLAWAQLAWAQEAPERNRRTAAAAAEKDRTFPPMERPCGTPGAIYSIVVDGNTLAVGVTLPFSIETSLPAEAKETLKKDLHDAILPMVERFYRDVWPDRIAGKIIDDTGRMPKRWEQLFTAWIKRKLWRKEWFVLDGKTMSNRHQVPYEYNQPEGPFDGPRDSY